MSTGDQPPPPEAGGEVKLEALSVSPMPVGLAPPSAAGGGGEPPQPAVSSSNKGGDDDDDSETKRIYEQNKTFAKYRKIELFTRLPSAAAK